MPQEYYQLFCFQTLQGVHFPKARAWYPEKAVTRNAHLKWTNRTSPPAQNNIEYSVTVMVNSAAYKVDKEITKQFLLEESDELVMMGSGGGAITDGSFGVDLPGCINVEDMPWACFPEPQYLNKINTMLDFAAARSRIVAPWISQEVYASITGKHLRVNDKGNYLQFLGFCVVVGSHFVEGKSYEHLCKDYGDLPLKDHSYACFLEMPHCQIHMKRIKAEWVKELPTWDSESQTITNIENWRVLTVTNSPILNPGIRVTSEEFDNCMTFTEKGMSYNTFLI